MKKLIFILLIGIFMISFVSADKIVLQKGWNMFGATIYGQNDTGTDKNITLSKGYNLIGISNYENYSFSNLNFTWNNGTVMTYQEAINGFQTNAYLSYWGTRTDGTKGYLPVPISDTFLRGNKAYFIYWNNTEKINLTLKNFGGGFKGTTIPFAEINFTNGTTQLDIYDALSEGWIGNSVDINSILYYWIPNSWVAVDETESISHWQGLMLWSKLDDITMCFGDPTCLTPPNNIELIPLNLTVTNGGRTSKVVMVTDNKSVTGFDSYDAPATSQSSNYTQYRTDRCASGNACRFSLDSFNRTDIPITINMTLFSNPNMDGLVNITWNNWNQTNLFINLTDYGTDTTRVTAVNSVILNNGKEFSWTLASARANNYFTARLYT